MSFSVHPNQSASSQKSEPAIQQHYEVKRRDSSDDSTLHELDPYLFELLDILNVKRRHGTQTEIDFCKVYMEKLPVKGKTPVKFNTLKDPVTKEVLAYYYKASNDKVMWSSHVDTVHHGAGKVQVSFDTLMQTAYVTDSSSPLGADDAAGVWLMFQMIRAGVPGTYVFHRGEEVGAIGSRGIAKHHQNFLKGFDYAIAFDRKDTSSVITYQAGNRCCSDAFADSFLTALNAQGLDYKKDDTGVFTDTKNYTDYIPECTNISCGYLHEHTTNETLDVQFLIKLKNALVAAFKNGFSNLKVQRKAGEKEQKTRFPSDNSRSFWNYNSEKDFTKYNKHKNLLAANDQENMTDLYFKAHDVTVFEAEDFDFIDTLEYNLYDEKILRLISKLSRMSKDDLTEELYNLKTPELLSVIKKLISESGY